MANEVLGRGLAMGIGEESTWGTAVARDRWFRLISSSIKHTVKVEMRPELAQGAGGLVRGTYPSQEVAAGQTVFLASFEGLGLLLKHALWAAATTTGSGPYTHTWKLGAAPPTGGLTVEVRRGSNQTGGTVYSDVFEGGRIKSLRAEVEKGGLVRVTIDWLFQTCSRGSAGSPTFTAGKDLIIRHDTAGTMGWNSSTFKVVAFALFIDNKLDRVDELGSLLTADPAPTAHREVMVEVTRNQRDNTLYTGHHGLTQSDLSLTFTSGTNSLTLEAHNAQLTELDDAISGVGLVQEKLKFVALSDDTDEGLEITLINSQSAAEAA